MSYRGHATAQPQGEVVNYRQSPSQTFLPVRPNEKFDLIFSPDRWFWGGPEYGFLPELGRLFHKPGCGGVSKTGIGHAINNQAVMGNIVIRVASLPGPLQGCVKAWPAAANGEAGKFYAYSWSDYKRVGRKAVPTVNVEDRNDFLKGLIDHGVIDEISNEARELYCSEMEYRLEKYRNRAESPGRQNNRRCRQEIKMMEKTLKEIEEFYNPSEEPESPSEAPKKAKKKGKKQTTTATEGDA